MRGYMFDALGPGCEASVAETAAGADVVVDCYPGVHSCGMVSAVFVEEAEVLAEMVFSKKGAGVERLISTGLVVVGFNMFRCGTLVATEGAGETAVLGWSLGSTSRRMSANATPAKLRLFFLPPSF